VFEQEDVAREEAIEVGLGRFEAVGGEELADEGGVGAAGELHVAGSVFDVEFGGAGALEGAHACAAGADEGAVDVEQG